MKKLLLQSEEVIGKAVMRHLNVKYPERKEELTLTATLGELKEALMNREKILVLTSQFLHTDQLFAGGDLRKQFGDTVAYHYAHDLEVPIFGGECVAALVKEANPKSLVYCFSANPKHSIFYDGYLDKLDSDMAIKVITLMLGVNDDDAADALHTRYPFIHRKIPE